jgi:hypothetical protein
MSKGALYFAIVMVVTSVGLSSPAFAKSGNSGGGQTTTSHATTNSGGANQTQSGNSQQSAGKKSKGSGKTYLKYDFKSVLVNSY